MEFIKRLEPVWLALVVGPLIARPLGTLGPSDPRARVAVPCATRPMT